MSTSDAKMAVRTRLKALCDAVYDEAIKNPNFFEQLERILLSTEAKVVINNKSESAPKKIILNLLETLHSEGRDALLIALEAKTSDELIRICTKEGIRKTKEAKAMTRLELINLLVETTSARLRQGESFTKQG
jgi:hypothetical protein